MEMKEKTFKKEYFKRTRKLHETKLYRRNLIKWSRVSYNKELETIFEMKEWKNFNKWTRKQKNSRRCLKPNTPEMTLTICMCQEKKEE